MAEGDYEEFFAHIGAEPLSSPFENFSEVGVKATLAGLSDKTAEIFPLRFVDGSSAVSRAPTSFASVLKGAKGGPYRPIVAAQPLHSSEIEYAAKDLSTAKVVSSLDSARKSLAQGTTCVAVLAEILSQQDTGLLTIQGRISQLCEEHGVSEYVPPDAEGEHAAGAKAVDELLSKALDYFRTHREVLFNVFVRQISPETYVRVLQEAWTHLGLAQARLTGLERELLLEEALPHVPKKHRAVILQQVADQEVLDPHEEDRPLFPNLRVILSGVSESRQSRAAFDESFKPKPKQPPKQPPRQPPPKARTGFGAKHAGAKPGGAPKAKAGAKPGLKQPPKHAARAAAELESDE